MSISSSLNAGVAGLSANAARLATISDNIANASTAGYKRSILDFNAMVVGSRNAGTYVAGGVRTTAVRLIDQNGALTGTNNATDIAITGRGFLPTTPIEKINAVGGTSDLQLVTTGSFRMDEQGYLRTSAGQVLLGWPATADGTILGQTRDSVASLKAIQVDTGQLSANPTTQMGLALNLPATDTQVGATGASHQLRVEYFTNFGLSENLEFKFTPVVPTAGGATNEWTMDITDSASGGSIASYQLTFNGGATAGTLASVTPLSGGSYNPTTGKINLTVPSGNIELGVGLLGKPGGLSQLSSEFVPSPAEKNGSPVANLVSLEVDTSGFLYGIYDQGFTRTLYKIPVVDVANPNGLTPLNNQGYQVSDSSGDFFLWDAGTGPVGGMQGFTLEESGADVATELTQLIQTQRAYTSNAKIIQTVDEMLQETTNLKR